MTFSVDELPSKVDVLLLSKAKAAEVILARALKGKVAPGNNPGFDVYQAERYPGETFQVKYSVAHLREAEEKSIGDRSVTIQDRYLWSFRVGNADHIADWYCLFGEKEGLVYPFVLSYSEWIKRSSLAQKARILIVSAREFSKCGRYDKSYKRNRTWEYHVKEWPAGLFSALDCVRSSDQLEMAFE